MNRQIQLLIVDDDEDMLEIESMMLVDRGYGIRTVVSVEEALDSIGSEKPDIVLLDLVFPENPEYGREAAKIIRNEYPNIPIFLVTSLNRSYQSRALNDPNYDELVQKPVDFEQLSEIIEHYVTKGLNYNT